MALSDHDLGGVGGSNVSSGSSGTSGGSNISSGGYSGSSKASESFGATVGIGGSSGLGGIGGSNAGSRSTGTTTRSPTVATAPMSNAIVEAIGQLGMTNPTGDWNATPSSSKYSAPSTSSMGMSFAGPSPSATSSNLASRSAGYGDTVSPSNPTGTGGLRSFGPSANLARPEMGNLIVGGVYGNYMDRPSTFSSLPTHATALGISSVPNTDFSGYDSARQAFASSAPGYSGPVTARSANDSMVDAMAQAAISDAVGATRSPSVYGPVGSGSIYNGPIVADFSKPSANPPPGAYTPKMQDRLSQEFSPPTPPHSLTPTSAYDQSLAQQAAIDAIEASRRKNASYVGLSNLAGAVRSGTTDINTALKEANKMYGGQFALANMTTPEDVAAAQKQYGQYPSLGTMKTNLGTLKTAIEAGLITDQETIDKVNSALGLAGLFAGYNKQSPVSVGGYYTGRADGGRVAYATGGPMSDNGFRDSSSVGSYGAATSAGEGGSSASNLLNAARTATTTSTPSTTASSTKSWLDNIPMLTPDQLKGAPLTYTPMTYPQLNAVAPIDYGAFSSAMGNILSEGPSYQYSSAPAPQYPAIWSTMASGQPLAPNIAQSFNQAVPQFAGYHNHPHQRPITNVFNLPGIDYSQDTQAMAAGGQATNGNNSVSNALRLIKG